MRRHATFICVAKWTGLVVSISIVLIWALSLRPGTAFVYSAKQSAIIIDNGVIVLLHHSHVKGTQFAGGFSLDSEPELSRQKREQDHRLWNHSVRAYLGLNWPTIAKESDGGGDTRWEICIHLWIIFFLVIVITGFLWHRRRSFSLGQCRRCGYNLTGNVSGRCSECGTPILNTQVV